MLALAMITCIVVLLMPALHLCRAVKMKPCRRAGRQAGAGEGLTGYCSYTQTLSMFFA